MCGSAGNEECKLAAFEACNEAYVAAWELYQDALKQCSILEGQEKTECISAARDDYMARLNAADRALVRALAACGCKGEGQQ
ncbi:hypothetical protein [Tolypothrix sp. VBCCA 56010]|uniref:hypothetical protein n=1 Tax=Tolypothrix sp. VBCCA 56010 TaxID=3137731 RepID=UPI003D7DF105